MSRESNDAFDAWAAKQGYRSGTWSYIRTAMAWQEALAYAERLACEAAPAAQPATPLREVLSDARITKLVITACDAMPKSTLVQTIVLGELATFARALLAASSDAAR